MNLEDLSVEEQFSVRVNAAMAAALRDGGAPDALATIAGNTAYELYEHYDAGNEYNSFPEFVVDSAFQAEEITQWHNQQDDSDNTA